MAERKVFTYKDVEEAKKYIGKPGVLGDNFARVSRGQFDRGEGAHGPLEIRPESADAMFSVKGTIFWSQFFSPDPEPVEEWVPFTVEDFPSVLGRGILRKDTGFGSIITTFGKSAFGTSCDYNPTPVQLLEGFTFLDGTPCGKKVTHG